MTLKDTPRDLNWLSVTSRRWSSASAALRDGVASDLGPSHLLSWLPREDPFSPVPFDDAPDLSGVPAPT